MNLGKMRPGNLQAFYTILDRLKRGEPTTSIVKPTRYGKRDLIITSAWQAVQDRLVSGALVFSPAAQATRQFTNESKQLQTIDRYQLPVRPVLDGIRQLRSFSEYQPFSNGEFLLALNIQLCLRTNIDELRALIDAERQRTGLPLAIFIDECQFVAEQKRWGEFFQLMIAAGALLVLLTATPYREDADAILGFQLIRLDGADERRYFTTDAGDGIHNRVDIWQGSRTVTVLQADDATTFQDAWKESPIVLCKLDRETVSVDIDGIPLANLSPTQTRDHLNRIVRSREFLDPALRISLQKLGLMQAIDPRTKGMIVTGNDLPNVRRDNVHAETIRELIAELSPAILNRAARVRVITVKTLEDDSAAKMMEAFFESDEDLLIVKQIGTIGLDDGRLKVLMDASPIRSVAAKIQTWMRPATPHEGLAVAHLVMPDDIISTAIWNKLVVEAGGEVKLAEMSAWAPEAFVDSYLKKKDEKPPDDERALGPGLLAGYDDSRGNVGRLDLYAAATRFLEVFPKMAQSYSKAEVALGLKTSGLGEPAPPPARVPWGLERQLEALYAQIWEDANEKANRWMRTQTGGAYDAVLYRESIRTIFTITYRQIGIPRGIELRDIKNIETLRQIDHLIVALSDVPIDA